MHVGNDIVDLASPYVKGKCNDRRFLRRVLTDEERQAVLASADPDSLIQIFWAAKETAYKSSVKIRPDVSSAPYRYRVRLVGTDRERNFSGSVTTPQSTIFITVHRKDDLVHCYGSSSLQAKKEIIFAVEKLTGPTATDFNRSSATVSRRVRTLAAGKIAALLSVPRGEITITKTGHGKDTPYPEVHIKQRKTDICLSLSHDGRFVACAFLLPQA